MRLSLAYDNKQWDAWHGYMDTLQEGQIDALPWIAEGYQVGTTTFCLSFGIYYCSLTRTSNCLVLSCGMSLDVFWQSFVDTLDTLTLESKINYTKIRRCKVRLRDWNYVAKRHCTYEFTQIWFKNYHDKISVYVKRHPRADKNTQLTSTQELVRIHTMCGYKIVIK